MIPSKVAFLLLLATTLVAFDPCKRYICRTPADSSNHEVCAKLEKLSSTNWVTYVGDCPSGKTCHLFVTDQSSIRCTGNVDIFKFPGQKCNDAKQCQGHLDGGYCRGKRLKEACNNHYDCDVGLVCSQQDHTCIEAAIENEYCHAQHPCKSYLYCMENRCIKFGSIENNNNPGKSDPDLCKSHHIYRGVCAIAPKLDGPIFVHTVEDVCDYTNGEHYHAECGFHKDGKAICKLGDGDMTNEWQALLDYLAMKPECHSELAHLSMCDFGETRAGRLYIKAGIAYYLLHHYVAIQENPPCLHKYNFPDYYDLISRYNSAGTISASIGLLITLLVFLL